MLWSRCYLVGPTTVTAALGAGAPASACAGSKRQGCTNIPFRSREAANATRGPRGPGHSRCLMPGRGPHLQSAEELRWLSCRVFLQPTLLHEDIRGSASCWMGPCTAGPGAGRLSSGLRVERAEGTRE